MKKSLNRTHRRAEPVIGTLAAALLTFCCSIPMATSVHAATITTIYTFGTAHRDPQGPTTNVTVFHGAVYGIDGESQIYRVSPSHNKIRVAFQAAGDEYYQGPLVECDAAIYGVVTINGERTYVIVKVDPLTTTGSTVYTFPASSDPSLQLACLNNKLYGGLQTLGQTDVGSLFSFDPASVTYTTIHTQTAEELAGVSSGLTAHGGILYGSAAGRAGKSDFRMIYYSVDPVTGQETILHRSSSAQGDIQGNAYFPVLVHGNDIFGFTVTSGAGDFFLYRVNIKTGHPTLLRDFNSQATGAYPNQSLIFRNGLLYGTLVQDNAHPFGTVFSLDPQTGTLTNIYAFTGGAEGGKPNSGLTYSGGTIYGTTISTEEPKNGGGTVFKLTP